MSYRKAATASSERLLRPAGSPQDSLLVANETITVFDVLDGSITMDELDEWRVGLNRS